MGRKAKKAVWKGIFPAICMPLNSDYSVDEVSLKKYVGWMAGLEGLGGLLVNGHASEVVTFSREERKRITSVIVDEVGQEIPVVSGINCEGTLEAVRHAEDAVGAGASAVMIQPVHSWLRSGVSQETAVTFIRDIAGSIPDTDVAVQVYPKTCKATYNTETIVEIARIPNVKVVKLGIRDCAAYEAAIRALRRECPDVAVFTSYDEALVMSLFEPIDGALIGMGGCIPELVAEAWNAVQSGDWEWIRDCRRRVDILSEAVYGTDECGGESHARAKEVLYQRGGIPSALARRPVLPLSQREKDRIAAAIQNAGITQIRLSEK